MRRYIFFNLFVFCFTICSSQTVELFGLNDTEAFGRDSQIHPGQVVVYRCPVSSDYCEATRTTWIYDSKIFELVGYTNEGTNQRIIIKLKVKNNIQSNRYENITTIIKAQPEEKWINYWGYDEWSKLGDISQSIEVIRDPNGCFYTKMMVGMNIDSPINEEYCRISLSEFNVNNDVTDIIITGRESVVLGKRTYFREGCKAVIRIKSNTSYSLKKINSSEDKLEDISSMEVAAIELQNTVLLYPNPTDGILNFECADADCSVKIYNLAGNLVYSNDQLLSGAIIDLSSQTHGIYLARIRVNGEIVKQRITLK